MMIIMLTTMGCLTIGMKTVNNLVMHDPIPLKESAEGVVRINTNNPIPLIVRGIKDKEFMKDIGGDVVIKPGWYSALIECWNSVHEKKVHVVKGK